MIDPRYFWVVDQGAVDSSDQKQLQGPGAEQRDRQREPSSG